MYTHQAGLFFFSGKQWAETKKIVIYYNTSVHVYTNINANHTGINWLED